MTLLHSAYVLLFPILEEFVERYGFNLDWDKLINDV